MEWQPYISPYGMCTYLGTCTYIYEQSMCRYGRLYALNAPHVPRPRFIAPLKISYIFCDVGPFKDISVLDHSATTAG